MSRIIVKKIQFFTFKLCIDLVAIGLLGSGLDLTEINIKNFRILYIFLLGQNASFLSGHPSKAPPPDALNREGVGWFFQVRMSRGEWVWAEHPDGEVGSA